MENKMRIKDLKETPDKGIGDNWDFKTFTNKPQKIRREDFADKKIFLKNFKGNYYYFMRDGYNTWYLILDDSHTYYIIGYLKLTKYDKIHNGMQVDGVDIHPDYQNTGLSTFMYREIKNKNNYSIVSDYIQYENSRKIWFSLSKTNEVKIFDENSNTMSNPITIDNINDQKIWGANHSKKLLVFESRSIEDIFKK